ncbi:syndecan-1 [Tiliqua scincoides]|uniref:syndecan-1 n=1 Tax=Tiliqua scincoides TaxID=71010 RepID=UPI003461F6AD
MARLMDARVLCALLFCLQAAWAQTADISLPPEDLDSSGDDDDSFSGSGAGAEDGLAEVAPTFSLQESTNSSLMHVVHDDLRDDQSEAGTDSPREDSEAVSPTSHLMTDKPPVAVEDELNSFTEQVTTRPQVITTRVLATHHTSTVRVSTSQDSSTAEVVVPKVNHETYHDASLIDKDVSTSEVVPTSESSLDAFSSNTTSSVPHKDISSLPEEVLSPEDGSGDVGDFIFGTSDENLVKPIAFEPENRAVDTGAKDEKSAAAPQGIMDRKEVLGGVIAGGLVGLLFAGVLVGFMLYRMKKKDEGSYSLDEPKQSNGGYQKPHKQEEFYA